MAEEQAQTISDLREKIRESQNKESQKKIKELSTLRYEPLSQRRKIGLSLHENSNIDQNYLDKVTLEARLAHEKNRNVELEQKLSFYGGLQRQISSNVSQNQRNIRDLTY